MKPKIKTSTWPNGQKMHEIPYVNGQMHGLATFWHDNRQKMHKAPYVNGKKHGLVTWWRENGQKSRETPYVNGQLHGLETGWFSDGSLRYAGNLRQGQWVWEMSFSSKEQIPEDAEVELFFHETPKFT